MMVLVPSENRRVKGESIDPSLFSQLSNHNASKKRLSTARTKEHIEQHEHFVALVVGKDGHIRFQSSPSLRRDREYILGDAIGRLSEWLRHSTNIGLQGGVDYVEPDLTGYQNIPSCRTGFTVPECDTGSISHPFQRRPKRRRSGTNGPEQLSTSDHESPSLGRPRKTIELMAGDKNRMSDWYRDAFMAVQQVSCRLIAKVWIKKIHQKKQSTHPYNGGFPRDLPRDSERTKPPYWPRDVRHKEPDHITKDERVTLLLNLIENTPLLEIVSSRQDAERQHLVSAEELLEAIEERRSDIKAEKWEILENIVRARTMQEKYDAGEIDATTVITVIDCSAETRRSQGETDADIADSDEEHLTVSIDVDDDAEDRHEGPQIFTPVSSTLASPADHLRPNLEQVMPNSGNNNTVAMINQFHSDHRKENLVHHRPETHSRSEQDAMGMRDRPPNISSSFRMNPDNFNGPIYQPTQETALPDERSTYLVDFNSLHHPPTMAHWQLPRNPATFLPQGFPNNGLHSRAMILPDQLAFDGNGFNHNAGTAPHGHGVPPYYDPHHFSQDFNANDERILPTRMRTASGLPTNIDTAHPQDLDLITDGFY